MAINVQLHPEDNTNEVLHPETSINQVIGASEVSKSGSYNDLTDKPTIPSLPINLVTYTETIQQNSRVVQLLDENNNPITVANNESSTKYFMKVIGSCDSSYSGNSSFELYFNSDVNYSQLTFLNFLNKFGTYYQVSGKILNEGSTLIVGVKNVNNKLYIRVIDNDEVNSYIVKDGWSISLQN